MATTTRKKITLTLRKDLILEAVRTDTYLTGQSEKTIDGANNARSFTEQAGNDQFHERKLQRTLYGAVGRFEVELADFIDSSIGQYEDPDHPGETYYSIDNTLTDAEEEFTIYFFTSSRFNEGLIKPMSQLAQEYLINKMVAMWWVAMKPDLANVYTVYANESLASIRKCLTKTSPETPMETEGGTSVPVSYDDVKGEAEDF